MRGMNTMTLAMSLLMSRGGVLVEALRYKRKFAGSIPGGCH
jgi:hypothetical protein